jgi:hypothetical protein
MDLEAPTEGEGKGEHLIKQSPQLEKTYGDQDLSSKRERLKEYCIPNTSASSSFERVKVYQKVFCWMHTNLTLMCTQ